MIWLNMLHLLTVFHLIHIVGFFAVHIMPGSLPRSLHSLDLSHNRITAIEGLRDLTRLRVLNMSHNRISRIGHGQWCSSLTIMSYHGCSDYVSQILYACLIWFVEKHILLRTEVLLTLFLWVCWLSFTLGPTTHFLFQNCATVGWLVPS